MSAEPISTLAAFPGVETFAKRSKYRLEDFNSLKAGTSLWRVKGLWPAVGVCFLGGPSMSGKSFLATDMLAKVCRGEPVLGRKAIAAGVVYVGAEDANGLRLRIEGLRQETGPVPDAAFRFIGQAPDLTDPDDVADMREAILDAKADMESGGMALGVVCIDTMSASIPGADENTAKDMSPVLHRLQEMAEELGVMVLMVAHTGKNADAGLRGWSGLLANADGLIMLDAFEDGASRIGTVVKVKNGPAGDQFAFGLRSIVTGQDADGDDVTTCIVEPGEVPERARAGRTATKAGQSGELIMAAFDRVWNRARLQISAPGAEGALGVEVADLRNEAYGLGVGPTDPDYSECVGEADKAKAKRKWQDQRKADFDRGLAHLTATKRLRTEVIGGVRLAWEPNKRSPR